jgi:hypothetical protein
MVLVGDKLTPEKEWEFREKKGAISTGDQIQIRHPDHLVT